MAIRRVVGRAQELDLIGSFLDEVAGGARALVLSGPAGIGKTTLFLAAVEEATRRGFQVAVSRPVEVETHLPFAGLIDLVDGLADAHLSALPEPQRVAVEAALFRTTVEMAPDPLGVSLGVLNILRRAASDRPLVLAIDDVPWLDESSARVLEFAIRRLDAEPFGLLAARRATGARVAERSGLIAGLPADRLATIDVGPIALMDTDRLLRDNLALELNRSALDRIHSTSGGNALYALELGRMLQRRPEDDELLKIPESLSDLVSARLGALPAAAAQLVLYAACLTNPMRPQLVAALGDDLVAEGLPPTVAAGVLETSGDSIRFSHPLLAAARYSSASDDERRDAHRRLAAVSEGLEERARHLAVATAAPDPVVADLLEASATEARTRGAADAAASLMERSAALTPAADRATAGRRIIAAAGHHAVAGDVRRARSLLEGLLATPSDNPFQCRVRTELGHLLMFQNDLHNAGELLKEALATASDDPRTRVAIERDLAGVAHLTGEDWEAGGAHIDAAMEIADSLDDPVVLLETIGHYATWEAARGRGLRIDLVERVRALQEWESEVRVMEHPELQFAHIRGAAGDAAGARDIVAQKLEEARRRGEWATVPHLLGYLAHHEIELGNLDRAASLAAESLDLVPQTGQDIAIGDAQLALLRIGLLRGDVDVADRVKAAEADRLSGLSRPWLRRQALATLALSDLSHGDPRAAFDRLAALDAIPGTPSVTLARELALLRVEALIGLGRTQEARAVLAPVRAATTHGDEPLEQAEALRCEALLLAAEGDAVSALEPIQSSLAILGRLGLPFQMGRALLVSGEVHRRARQKAAARREFEAAGAIFDRLGARPWLERARAELGRTARIRERPTGMTDTERQIADLVALGRSNREIAGSLFLSVHTVEAHLTRIYRELGIQSRTELAGVVLAGTPGETATAPGEPSSR